MSETRSGCTHPEKRTPECHGDARHKPGECDCDCHGHEQPGDCSPEQIRECHGDVEQHPCESAL